MISRKVGLPPEAGQPTFVKDAEGGLHYGWSNANQICKCLYILGRIHKPPQLLGGLLIHEGGVINPGRGGYSSEIWAY